MSSEPKIYQKENLLIHWKPELCIHSGNCVRGLKEVFKPRDKPWVQPENANREDIIKTVNTCPSGALSWSEEA